MTHPNLRVRDISTFHSPEHVRTEIQGLAVAKFSKGKITERNIDNLLR